MDRLEDPRLGLNLESWLLTVVGLSSRALPIDEDILSVACLGSLACQL